MFPALFVFICDLCNFSWGQHVLLCIILSYLSDLVFLEFLLIIGENVHYFKSLLISYYFSLTIFYILFSNHTLFLYKNVEWFGNKYLLFYFIIGLNVH
jgi:hypothetical protein